MCIPRVAESREFSAGADVLRSIPKEIPQEVPHQVSLPNVKLKKGGKFAIKTYPQTIKIYPQTKDILQVLRELQLPARADHSKVGEKTGYQEEIKNQVPVKHLAALIPVMVLEDRSLNLQTTFWGFSI